MRILMLAQFYPPIIGGEEQHVRNLSRQLVARGHHVAVATLRHDDAPAFEIDDGVCVHRLNGSMQRARFLYGAGGRQHAPPFPDPEAMWGIRRVIAQERPDLIHAHNWLVHSFVPLKRWAGAPLVLTLHDYSLVCATKRLMYHGHACSGPALAKCAGCVADHYGAAKGAVTAATNWVAGLAERAAVDMFLPVSRAVAEATELRARRLPFQVMPNFLPDTSAENESGHPELLAALPEEPFILFVGDVGKQKGVDILLQAYAQIWPRPPLVIIGRRLPDTPRELPDGARMFHDWPHDAVMAAWRRSLFGVVPSVWPDPCPTVALEAMRSGKAVIAARSGGLVDQVADGETGYLVPPADTTALQTAMAELIADTGRSEEMGRVGRERVALFQAGTVVPRIEQVYRSLVGKETAEPNNVALATPRTRGAGDGW
jgi:glycosyltransferase involved in cell wall biosynthesis